MATEDRGFASMDPEQQRKIASKGGMSQGKNNNPGNFANRDPADVRKAAHEGGKQSHASHLRSDE
jgi:general stress protein YciG